MPDIIYSNVTHIEAAFNDVAQAHQNGRMYLDISTAHRWLKGRFTSSPPPTACKLFGKKVFNEPIIVNFFFFFYPLQKSNSTYPNISPVFLRSNIFCHVHSLLKDTFGS